MAQQFVILARTGNGDAPLGSRKEIVSRLAGLNTCPETDGEDVLWGPGIRIDLPPDQDPVRQMLLGIVEEEIAWLVIMRLARECQWRVVDMETGDELVPE
ncbi:MAG: hypothetical protein MK101_00585 [Phycisphaerales bacterium]|nr:hypothetical protein [Phycisphaerales bacterium]